MKIFRRVSCLALALTFFSICSPSIVCANDTFSPVAVAQDSAGRTIYAYQTSTSSTPPAYVPIVTTAGASAMLTQVPTSSWTYGCSATSAGMIFGYYDRIGYSNMYTGPSNGGVCPLTNLGNACSIIATKKGFDGRTTFGHVDDYWIDDNCTSDPYIIAGRTEHTWGGCTADYMGTNQWKFDVNNDSTIDYNKDGGTLFYSYSTSSPDKLYDCMEYVNGKLIVDGCHGMRSFAESRGYTVLENYTQSTDNVIAGGFSFQDYMTEIDNGCPVMIQVVGHSMVGVGYDEDTSTVYLHNTWGDYLSSMTWGGDYVGMDMYAVSVIHLESVPEPASLILLAIGSIGFATFSYRRRQKKSA